MESNKRTCVAKTLASLEQPLVSELEEMGFKVTRQLKRAVEFESDLKGVYMANLNLRTAMSILMPVNEFKFKDVDEFIKKVSAIHWEKLFDIKKTFLIRTTVFSAAFKNTNYPALLVKDSIVDRFREIFDRRPNVDKERPDVVVDVYVSDDRCSISLNSSGNPLYMRGYRNVTFEAPLNECLAAGLVHLSGWKKDGNFINPMCGSGTISIEATMMALNVHPAKLREDFAFKQWKNFDQELFQSCRDELIKKEKKEFKHSIQASDLSNRALSITRNSLSLLQLNDHVDLFKMNFFKPIIKSEEGTIILNPPYDERLQEDDIDDFYTKIGQSLKFQYAGHKAWIFSSHMEALKKIGLKTFKKLDLYNGKLPCKFQGYELFEGRRNEN